MIVLCSGLYFSKIVIAFFCPVVVLHKSLAFYLLSLHGFRCFRSPDYQCISQPAHYFPVRSVCFALLVIIHTNFVSGLVAVFCESSECFVFEATSFCVA